MKKLCEITRSARQGSLQFLLPKLPAHCARNGDWTMATGYQQKTTRDTAGGGCGVRNGWGVDIDFQNLGLNIIDNP